MSGAAWQGKDTHATAKTAVQLRRRGPRLGRVGHGAVWLGELGSGTDGQGEETYGWSHRRFDSADVGCGDAGRCGARLGTVWRGEDIPRIGNTGVRFP